MTFTLNVDLFYLLVLMLFHLTMNSYLIMWPPSSMKLPDLKSTGSSPKVIGSGGSPQDFSDKSWVRLFNRNETQSNLLGALTFLSKSKFLSVSIVCVCIYDWIDNKNCVINFVIIVSSQAHKWHGSPAPYKCAFNSKLQSSFFISIELVCLSFKSLQ